jgi:predicted Zn-dependent protease
MRSQAIILRSGHEAEKADAIVIMANPGGCVPKDSSYVYPVLHEDIRQRKFVKAKTDPTQYQLMNLMELMNFNRLYILNLSDICEGNYDNFRQYLNLFQTSKNESHSIFSQEREGELSKLMDGDVPYFGLGNE